MKGLLLLLGTACATVASRPPSRSLPIPGLEAVRPGMLVLFGELHGTVEAPAFVGDAAIALARQAKVHVGLELPAADTPSLMGFLAGDDRALLDTPTWKRVYQDGRTSQAMLELLRRLRAARSSGMPVEVFFFDDQDRLGIEHRDEAMAENIAAARSRAPGDIFLVEVGDWHAKKSVGAPWDPSRRWMASYLGDHGVLALDARGPAGTAWYCTAPESETCGVHKQGNIPGRSLPPGLPRRAVTLQPLDGYDGIFVVESLTASPPASSGSPPFEVALQAKNAELKLSDQLVIQVELINMSTTTDLYLYGSLDWGESASLSLWAKDASGRDVPQTFIADSIPPAFSKDEFVKIQTYHLIGVVLSVPLGELGIRKSGSYQLWVEYHSPVPARMSFGLPIWSTEKGIVQSNLAWITVRD